MSDDKTAGLPALGVLQNGNRLECVACGEVWLWCQCEPSPFSAADRARLDAALREDMEAAKSV